VLGYKQYQIMRYVEAKLSEDGVAPSYNMISRELDMTRGDVCRAVQRLERRGMLSRVGAGRVRRIQLTKRLTI
jgi:DNA-binding MarR family transcriptional regulator